MLQINFFECMGVLFTAILAILFAFVLWGFFKVRAEMKKKPTSDESSSVKPNNCKKFDIPGYENVVIHEGNAKGGILKDAQGDELPAYDREVIVLIQDYPDDEEHLRVAYGHRPNPNGYVTKDGEKLYPMTYDKGGWNGKNVRYWLDVKLPNQPELQ